MNVTLAVLGIVLIGAAIVGGGLEAFNIKFPILTSRPRQLLLAVVGLISFGAAFVAPGLNIGTSSSSQPPVKPTVTVSTSQGISPTPSPRITSAPTPVWTSPNPMLIPGTGGIDFDSNPPGPGSGSNTLILYAGNELYTSGSIKIAAWSKNVPPNRDQCNVLAQTQGSFEQPAETGRGYCLLTEQGHTVYLKITSIDASNTADIKAYANITVWNTAG